MKELPKEFIGAGEVEGFTFKQIAFSAYCYAYEITSETGKLHYEVFERKEQPESDTVIAGLAIHHEAKVKYPKSGNFGLWAWCFRDFYKALEKFNDLNNLKKSTDQQELTEALIV